MASKRGSAAKRAPKVPSLGNRDALAAVREALVGRGVPGVVWYAKGEGVARTGPFKSAYLAKQAMRLVPLFEERERLPEGFAVWPEPEE